MRIAQLTDTFLPVVDGVGRVVYQYANCLSVMGHECYVITPLQSTGYRGHLPFEIIDFMSVKVPSIPQYRAGVALMDLHYIERMATVELDLLHAHAPGLAGAEAMRLAEKLKIPLVGTFHSKYYDDLRRVTHSDVLALVGSRFVAEFYERCDAVWTVSQDAAETLHSYGYRGAIDIIQNGTEIRTPEPEVERRAREAFHLGSDPILLFVGQIDYKKNLRRVIEAAQLLKQHGRAFQLVLAGQGRDREALEMFAKERDVTNALFTGHITDRDLLDGLYKAAALFVFPSLYETAGLVVREAAVMGTPSVVVRNTAPAEVIEDGVNGLLCLDDAEDLCSTIEYYCYTMTDEQRDGMGVKARESIPLPWEKVMTEVEARYQLLIAKGRTVRSLILP